MKKVEAVFRPERLDSVRTALETLERSGMTVFEVRGHGVQGGVTQQWRGEEYRVGLLPKVMVMVVVHDHEVQEAIETIATAARTGSMGDGKVFVTPVEQALRIRTGESGPQAI